MAASQPRVRAITCFCRRLTLSRRREVGQVYREQEKISGNTLASLCAGKQAYDLIID